MEETELSTWNSMYTLPDTMLVLAMITNPAHPEEPRCTIHCHSPVDPWSK